MIPTFRKDKLPRTLAYPSGAQAVTNALLSIPHREGLELWFMRREFGPADEDGLHRVIVVRYEMRHVGLSAASFMVESGFYGPKWDISVYAVPRELNARIRESLRTSGFDIIRQWLAADRSELWLTSSHSCTLSFCPVSDSLVRVGDDD